MDMDRERMLEMLKAVRSGDMAPEAALQELAKAPYEDIGYARIDHHRRLRNGNSEVIYGAGKTAEQIAGIVLNPDLKPLFLSRESIAEIFRVNAAKS